MIDIAGFVFHESVHFGIAGVFAVLFFIRYRDWRLVLVALVMGILVDIDHWFDYFFYFGPRVNLINFLNVSSYVVPSGRTYIPFHGWEYFLLLWWIGRWWGKKKQTKGLEWAISLPYLGHLVWDHLSLSHHPLAYSFLFRLLNHFQLERII